MTPIDNILVIIDPTAQQHPAVEKAAQLAKVCGARLDLYACDTRESSNLRREAALHADSGSATLDAMLQALAKPIADSGVVVEIESDAGDPLHAKLLERTRRKPADLVVKDTHHHSLARRTFITNTDWHLIRGCASPLLLVKASPWGTSASLGAAIDPGHVEDRTVALDQRILQWTQSLAQALGGTTHAVHAFLPLEAVVPGATGGTEVGIGNAFAGQITDEALAARRTQLQEFIAPYGIEPARLHVQLGVASEVLPSVAAAEALDVLVMGAISRSGLARLFIGSTAERVLEQLPCDALILKPEGFAAAEE